MLTLFADVTPLAAVSLGVGMAGVVSIPALLLADAHRSDFDPRPAVRRATNSEALYLLLREWDIARHASREALRDAAALLLLLTTSPKGAIR
jgi:hypothetical protein